MSDNDKTLLPRRLALAEARRNIWFATAPEDVEIDDVLRPGFWAHVAPQLQAYDEIICGRDDSAWRLTLLVTDTWAGGATVIELSRIDMGAANKQSTDELNSRRVAWRGPHARWAVIDAEGVILRAGLPDRETALQNMAAIA